MRFPSRKYVTWDHDTMQLFFKNPTTGEEYVYTNLPAVHEFVELHACEEYWEWAPDQ